MAINFHDIEDAVRKTVHNTGKELFDIHGQIFFPIYASSGGLSSKCMIYVKSHSALWPTNCDMGREGQSKCNGVHAIEFELNSSSEQIERHILEVLALAD